MAPKNFYKPELPPPLSGPWTPAASDFVFCALGAYLLEHFFSCLNFQWWKTLISHCSRRLPWPCNQSCNYSDWCQTTCSHSCHTCIWMHDHLHEHMRVNATSSLTVSSSRICFVTAYAFVKALLWPDEIDGDWSLWHPDVRPNGRQWSHTMTNCERACSYCITRPFFCWIMWK